MELYGRGTNLFIISILFVFIAFILVMSRLMSRVTTARKLGPDDYAIILSIVSTSDQAGGNSSVALSTNLADLDHRFSQSDLPSATASVRIC